MKIEIPRKYSLEELIKKFLSHDHEWRKQQDRLIKEFKENNPNEKLPEHFNGDFSLPLALASICYEISKLKE